MHEDSGRTESVENRPDRIEWYQDCALGMYLFWNIDSQLGMVNSHSLVGASRDYVRRYYNELPKTFNPKSFDAEWYARLAKVAGFKYLAFTAKSHSGFCMFDTQTTDFNVVQTPYGRDITREIIDACRTYGIAVGLYFSPDDFSVLYRQGREISRVRPEASPANNPELMELALAQLRELLTNYGPIDVMIIDGPVQLDDPDHRMAGARKLRELCWELQPDTVVTRGSLPTPEQRLVGDQGAFEAHFTIGNQWQYKPTNEVYKSGRELIELLVQIRSQGGTLLLAVGGPSADGLLVEEMEGRVRELGLWNFINGEAIYEVRPWHVPSEGPIYLTRAKSSNTAYAVVTGEAWRWGERRTITLRSVQATDETEVEILGQSGELAEYQPWFDARTTWKQDAQGLHISAARVQRIYNNRDWPNPVVLKITHARTTGVGGDVA